MTAMRLHIADLLTVTTGRLLCRDETPIEGVYRILNHMTGQSLYTHQLVPACHTASPALVQQFPWLDGLEPPEGVDLAGLLRWVDEVAAEHGEWHHVKPMPSEAWGNPDPIADLVEMVGADRVTAVVVDGPVPS